MTKNMNSNLSLKEAASFGWSHHGSRINQDESPMDYSDLEPNCSSTSSALLDLVASPVRVGPTPDGRYSSPRHWQNTACDSWSPVPMQRAGTDSAGTVRPLCSSMDTVNPETFMKVDSSHHDHVDSLTTGCPSPPELRRQIVSVVDQHQVALAFGESGIDQEDRFRMRRQKSREYALFLHENDTEDEDELLQGHDYKFTHRRRRKQRCNSIHVTPLPWEYTSDTDEDDKGDQLIGSNRSLPVDSPDMECPQTPHAAVRSSGAPRSTDDSSEGTDDELELASFFQRTSVTVGSSKPVMLLPQYKFSSITPSPETERKASVARLDGPLLSSTSRSSTMRYETPSPLVERMLCSPPLLEKPPATPLFSTPRHSRVQSIPSLSSPRKTARRDFALAQQARALDDAFLARELSPQRLFHGESPLHGSRDGGMPPRATPSTSLPYFLDSPCRRRHYERVVATTPQRTTSGTVIASSPRS
jgi:hypothetical protein